MAKTDSQSVEKYGYSNMRGNPVRNVGKPTSATDAMTFAAPSFTTTERDAIPVKVAGMVLFNSSTSKLQCWNGATWSDLF